MYVHLLLFCFPLQKRHSITSPRTTNTDYFNRYSLLRKLFILVFFKNNNIKSLQNQRYPFDWKTPVGYVTCVLIQIITFYAVTSIFVIVLILIIGFCMFLTNFGNDLEENVFEMNKMTRQSSSAIEETKIKKRFIDIIQFHSDAREFVIHCILFLNRPY